MTSAQNQQALNLINRLRGDIPCVIVLSGIPGSGKSTFAQILTEAMNERTRTQWAVLNQDVLLTRQRVIEEMQTALNSGKSVIVDRCNFDRKQRKYWIELAHQNAVRCVISITLQDVEFEECVKRANTRGEDGIHSKANWHHVCSIMSRQSTVPMISEGFSAVYTCRSGAERDTIRDAVLANVSRSN